MPADLLDAVTEAATAGTADWFPELVGSGVGVRCVASQARARCFLHRVEIDDGRRTRTVVVKVRHAEASLRRLDRHEDRPMLLPERTMSERDSARREYDNLRQIATALTGASPERYGVLRALAWLPEQAGIVMDLVEEPTLRARLLRTSRLDLRRHGPLDEAPWRNAGAWLRRFHDHVPADELSARLATRGDVEQHLAASAAFLLRQGGDGDVVRRIADHPAAVTTPLSADLQLAAGHGDFVANNMFASDTGRITVFDPLTRWRVPRHHDLATLTTGLRILPVQATTRGLALSSADLSRYERALLAGYFGERVPWEAVRVHQLLVLLDRWSALVSKTTRAGAARSMVRGLRVGVAKHHFAGEARRLAHELERTA